MNTTRFLTVTVALLYCFFWIAVAGAAVYLFVLVVRALKMCIRDRDKDTFSIYQIKGGDETRDFRFEPYDRLQAAGDVVCLLYTSFYVYFDISMQLITN